MLGGAVVVAGPLDALLVRGVVAVQAFAEARGTVVLCGTGNWDPAWSRSVPLLSEAQPPTAERGRLWKANVGGADTPGLDPVTATIQFRLSPEQIKRASEAARLQAEAAGRPVEVAALRAGARAQNAAGLERLARRIEPPVGFDGPVPGDDAVGPPRELTAR